MNRQFGRTPAASSVLLAAVLTTAGLALALLGGRASALVVDLVLVPPAIALVPAVGSFLIPRPGLARQALVAALVLAGLAVLAQFAAAFTPAVLGTPATVLVCVAAALRLAGI